MCSLLVPILQLFPSAVFHLFACLHLSPCLFLISPGLSGSPLSLPPSSVATALYLSRSSLPRSLFVLPKPRRVGGPSPPAPKERRGKEQRGNQRTGRGETREGREDREQKEEGREGRGGEEKGRAVTEGREEGREGGRRRNFHGICQIKTQDPCASS